MRQFFLSLLLMLGICSIHAQTTYTVVPTTCTGTAGVEITSCPVDMAPTNDLGIYPYMIVYDLFVNASTTSQGYLQFATTKGPSGGYIGGAQIDSATVNGKTVTLAFHGTYAPDSGGGPYTGTATLTIGTTVIKSRWHTTVIPAIEGGTVTIGAATPDALSPTVNSPIAPTPVCPDGPCPKDI